MLVTAGTGDPASNPNAFYCRVTGLTTLGTAAGGPFGPRPDTIPCVAPKLLETDQIYATSGSTLSNYTLVTGGFAARASSTTPIAADVLIPAP